jgi:hypothetical protein
MKPVRRRACLQEALKKLLFTPKWQCLAFFFRTGCGDRFVSFIELAF